MGYLDFSDAELRALTRLRRAELKARRDAARPETIRYSAKNMDPVEFVPVISATVGGPSRQKGRYKAWRNNQFLNGNTKCAYCSVELAPLPRKVPKGWKPPMDLGTVDHHDPLALGGTDHPENWRMCCWECNNLKGKMPPEEFLAYMVFVESLKDGDVAQRIEQPNSTRPVAGSTPAVLAITSSSE